MNEFYFMRHAETDYNTQNRYIGIINNHINGKSTESVKIKSKLLLQRNISNIYSSPLIRCVETSGFISNELNIRYMVISNIRERNFGILSGKKKVSYRKTYFPMGDSSYKFKMNTKRGLTKIKSICANGTYLIVGHSGTYSVLKKYLNIKSTIKKARHAQPIHIYYANNEWHATELV